MPAYKKLSPRKMPPLSTGALQRLRGSGAISDPQMLKKLLDGSKGKKFPAIGGPSRFNIRSRKLPKSIKL